MKISGKMSGKIGKSKFRWRYFIDLHRRPKFPKFFSLINIEDVYIFNIESHLIIGYNEDENED